MISTMRTVLGLVHSRSPERPRKQPGPRPLAVEHNRWLAALLCIFPVPIGLGYLYVGRPARFWGAFILAIILAFPVLVLVLGLCAVAGCGGEVILVFLPNLGLSLVFALDSWRIAGDQEAARQGRTREKMSAMWEVLPSSPPGLSYAQLVEVTGLSLYRVREAIEALETA